MRLTKTYCFFFPIYGSTYHLLHHLINFSEMCVILMVTKYQLTKLECFAQDHTGSGQPKLHSKPGNTDSKT